MENISELPSTSTNNDVQYIKKVYFFDSYEVEVMLDENNRFIGIVKIKSPAAFFNSSQTPSFFKKTAEELLDELVKDEE